MTNEEIRQKAIEYSKTMGKQTCCHPCEECEYSKYYWSSDTTCFAICGYEHGFADGVEEGKKQANLDNNIECSDCVRQLSVADEKSIRADERKKVLDEVREITKTIEADDILARAESCGKNCRKCDGCLTRILFEQLKGERSRV